MHKDQASDIESRFTYHAPTVKKVADYDTIRATAKNFAILIAESVPGSRERALALTKLEEAVMWANAGIARSVEPPQVLTAPQPLTVIAATPKLGTSEPTTEEPVK